MSIRLLSCCGSCLWLERDASGRRLLPRRCDVGGHWLYLHEGLLRCPHIHTHPAPASHHTAQVAGVPFFYVSRTHHTSQPA